MRVVFMGSPAFGLPTLQAIERAGHAVTLVVTQPDRPAGRARRLRPPPVAAYARSRQLPLHQPERLRPTSALAPIQAADPEVIVVAAFGLLLPAALLALPRHGCLNVHPSLLPRHRGASPIQAAILGGDAKTGVTIIKLVEQMDAGPILAQTATPIGPDEDAIALEGRLAELGAALLVDCLEPWVAGAIEPRPQDEQLATYCRRLDRTDALLDWSQPAERLGRVVRAFRGRTDAFTFWEGRPLKVLAARPLDVEPAPGRPGLVATDPPSGRGRRPIVQTGRGALALVQVALAGRPPTSGEALLNGYPSLVGATLGADGVLNCAE